MGQDMVEKEHHTDSFKLIHPSSHLSVFVLGQGSSRERWCLQISACLLLSRGWAFPGSANCFSALHAEQWEVNCWTRGLLVPKVAFGLTS